MISEDNLCVVKKDIFIAWFFKASFKHLRPAILCCFLLVGFVFTKIGRLSLIQNLRMFIGLILEYQVLQLVKMCNRPAVCSFRVFESFRKQNMFSFLFTQCKLEMLLTWHYCIICRVRWCNFLCVFACFLTSYLCSDKSHKYPAFQIHFHAAISFPHWDSSFHPDLASSSPVLGSLWTDLDWEKKVKLKHYRTRMEADGTKSRWKTGREIDIKETICSIYRSGPDLYRKKVLP